MQLLLAPPVVRVACPLLNPFAHSFIGAPPWILEICGTWLARLNHVLQDPAVVSHATCWCRKLVLVYVWKPQKQWFVVCLLACSFCRAANTQEHSIMNMSPHCCLLLVLVNGIQHSQPQLGTSEPRSDSTRKSGLSKWLLKMWWHSLCSFSECSCWHLHRWWVKFAHACMVTSVCTTFHEARESHCSQTQWVPLP